MIRDNENHRSMTKNDHDLSIHGQNEMRFVQEMGEQAIISTVSKRSLSMTYVPLNPLLYEVAILEIGPVVPLPRTSTTLLMVETVQSEGPTSPF